MTGKSQPPSGVGISPQHRQLFERQSERIDVLSGFRGNPLDRALTPRDLIDLGLAKVLGKLGNKIVAGGNFTPVNPPKNTAIPPRPENLDVIGGLANIFLTWENARQAYSNHAYTAIFRNTEDNIANAVEVAQATGSSMYADLDVHYGTE